MLKAAAGLLASRRGASAWTGLQQLRSFAAEAAPAAAASDVGYVAQVIGE
jgi:hypothetical protein